MYILRTCLCPTLEYVILESFEYNTLCYIYIYMYMYMYVFHIAQ